MGRVKFYGDKKPEKQPKIKPRTRLWKRLFLISLFINIVLGSVIYWAIASSRLL
jgi:uncharacterized protein YpmS